MPQGTPSAHPPEKKWPLPGGASVTLWVNTLETEHGPVPKRSVKIGPRRYRDRTTGAWKDGSFRVADLPLLVWALNQAFEFCMATPTDSDD